jgi:hypothetical protein
MVVTMWSPLGLAEGIEVAESSAKLTKRAVDNAVPKRGRYIPWDTELKGFALRVAESGTKTYILRYRPRGTGRTGPRRFMVLGRHGVLTPDEARRPRQNHSRSSSRRARPGQGTITGKFREADRTTRRPLHR